MLCRQLFKKITFAFMKIFDFLVKIAIFGAFLFQSRNSRHALLPKTNDQSWQNVWRKSLDQKRNSPKMANLTKKSKIFIKAKVIFMKSCLLGHVSFMIRWILNNFIFSWWIYRKVQSTMKKCMAWALSKRFSSI